MSAAPPETDPPARRRRLGREAVLVAAEDLLDRDGVQALTMTSLALHVGTKVSSLYNHVGGLDDLRAQLQRRAIQSVGRDVRSAAMGRSGADGIRHLAQVYVAWARRHPHRYEIMTRALIDPDDFYVASTDAAEAIAVMVRTLGVPESEVLRSQLALFAAIHGYVVAEVTGFFPAGDDLLDGVVDQVVEGGIAAAERAAAER
jgi:AcrR family transcriptional regulator